MEYESHWSHPLMARLRYLRMTVLEFAELMGVTDRAVRYWVTGERRMSGRQVRKACAILGVEPEQLTGTARV